MLKRCAGVERIVVDASVAVKWFAAERDVDKALKLKDSYQAEDLKVAPTLISYEVMNALRFHPYYRLT